MTANTSRSGPADSRKYKGAYNEPNRELYDAFQRVQFDRWDPIIANDALIKARAGCDIRGIKTLKEFGAQLAELGCRIDLIDEHVALDRKATVAVSLRSWSVGRTSKTSGAESPPNGWIRQRKRCS